MLDYQTQQAKIFPSIALAYAYLFAGKNIILMYFQVTSQIQQGDTSMLPEVRPGQCLVFGEDVLLLEENTLTARDRL